MKKPVPVRKTRGFVQKIRFFAIFTEYLIFTILAHPIGLVEGLIYYKKNVYRRIYIPMTAGHPLDSGGAE